MEMDALYREVVERASDGIWVFDLSGSILYANPAVAAMFGSSREEVERLTVFDALDEAGRQQFAEHLEQVRAGHVNDGDVEVKFVRQDGSSFWALVGESVLDGPGGTPLVVHRFADFDERRRVLDELTESRRQLAEGHRLARLGSWHWDLAADLISGSESLVGLYGLRPGFLPATFSSFLEHVHPYDLPLVQEAVDGALAGADEFLFQARIFGADDWIWTRGHGVVHRDQHGTARSVTGTFQDITEMKHAEVALRDQVAQNTLMQAVASAANEARTLEDVLVHARPLVLLHDDWERARAFLVTEDGTDVLPLHVTAADRAEDEATPEESARELELARRCLKEGVSVWDEQRLTIAFAVRFGGAAYAVLTLTSSPPLHRHELIRSMVESMADQLGRVVEREQAERALAAARDQAMEASRQKSEFLATMSHEIRTPLNGVIGLNDLLLRTDLDPGQQRLASGVQAASRQLLGLINDILDFSKIEAGKLTLEQVDFEVRDVLDQVTAVLGETAREKGLELVVACDSSVPGVLCGDPTRLAQVVTNLGSNAVKFTDAGEVMVLVSATSGDGRTVLRVEVTDTGIGIEPAELDQIFESFTQADASTTRVHGGTGLGLAISREIVHALGGEIGVSSQPGQGSVFWFTAQLDRARGPAIASADDEARSLLSGRRALVVDEHERHRSVLAARLAWWGVRCDGAASLEEAGRAVTSAAAAGDPQDVVLVHRALLRHQLDDPGREPLLPGVPAGHDVPVLLLSPTSDLDPDTARALGISDCLATPVSSGVLREVLLEHVVGVRSAAADHGVEDTGDVRRHRVLVVEDNHVNQMVTVGLLEALGYDADVADDGQAAIEAYDPARHSAVLMDVQMPRLDGYAATRTIRSRHGHGVPVIAMTAAAVEGERERCLEAGMDDFLTKPVDPEGLLATLKRWLDDGSSGSRPASASGPGSAYEVAGRLLDLERLDMLRDLAAGDTSYLDRAIDNFAASVPGHLDAVRRAVADEDPPALVQAAHKLAGSAANLGVVQVATAARELELLADSGSTEGSERRLPALATALEQGRAALLAYRAAYGGTAADGSTGPPAGMS